MMYKNIGSILSDNPKDLDRAILELQAHRENGWEKIFFELKANGEPIFYLQRDESDKLLS